MNAQALRVMLAGLTGLFIFPGGIEAQTTPVKQTLVCESLDRQRKDCPARIRGNVRLVRLLGSTKCLQNLNWTWSSGGIVVTNGCRAEFEFDAEPDESTARSTAPWTIAQRRAYDAGNVRGQSDSRSRMSRNAQRYAREFDSYSEPYFLKGYNDGFDGLARDYRFAGAERWTNRQQEAYDRGYTAGERDSRDNKNRNHKRYSREFGREDESYFRDGYEDAFDGRPRDYRLSQTGQGDYGSASTVVCESQNQKLTECRIEEGSAVRLVRQLSDARCVQGESWGTRRATLWVDRGCRAEFEVRPPAARNSTAGGAVTTLTCESNYNEYKECRIEERSDVRLRRQLSRVQCVQGQTWGVRRNAIWVDRGCRAEFEVRSRR